MFSDNEKISARQLKRLVLFDLFGVGSLVLPPRLAAYAGTEGTVGILLALLAGALFFAVLCVCIRQMQGTYFDYLARVFGRFLAVSFYIVYAVISLWLCVCVTGLLADLICVRLLAPDDFYLVYALLLALGLYGASSGVEARARIYELLFWLLVVPLIVMLALCVRFVEPARWFPFYGAQAGSQLFSGAFFAFLTFLPICYVPFFVSHVKNVRRACAGVWKAFFLTGAAFFFLYLLLLGTFGAPALAVERYPVITLLEMVKIPGGFLKRLDTVMLAVWFFTLYALLATALYYGAEIGAQAFGAVCGKKGKKDVRPGKTAFLPAVFFVAAGGYLYHTNGVYRSFGNDVFYRVAVPFLLLVPVISCLLFTLRFWKKHAGRKLSAGFFIVLCASVLCGCRATELENRSFPLAVFVEKEASGCSNVYLFQKLSEISNERASGENATENTAFGDTFFAAQKTYEKNNRCRLDMSHTKALVFTRSFFQDTASMDNFLQYVKRENVFARNTLVYVTDEKDAGRLAKLNGKLEVPLGTYLEQMTANEQDIADTAVPTLGTLLRERENRCRAYAVPVLCEENGLPVIRAYELVSDGVPKGELTVQDAMMYFLLNNGLKELDLQAENGAQVRLTGLSCERTFMGTADGVRESVLIRAKADALTGDVSGRQLQKQLEGQVRAAFLRAKKDFGVDLSDSFSRLPMEAPELAQAYKNRAKQYRDGLETAVTVLVIIQ